tara:strand:- start:212 stop:448 length:237 start_codon:yes stop_codon:yes gene_type:complete
MGEYECWDCDKKFHLEEPPYDGREICDPCRNQIGWEDLSDGEVLDVIFNRFGIVNTETKTPTQDLISKIDKLLEGTNG